MKWIKWIILFLTIAFGIPMFLEFFIFRNNFPSVLTNGEWASFFGSFLGGVVSLIGIYLTIQFTQAENKKERELMYRPHIRVTACKPNSEFEFVSIPTVETYVPDGKNCCIGIVIKNVGLGPVLDYTLSEFEYEHTKDGKKYSPLSMGTSEIFEREEIEKFCFEFNLNVNDTELQGVTLDDPIKSIDFLRRGGIFSFKIKGTDICGNPVEKEVKIAVKTQICGDGNGNLRYEPYASLMF